MSNDIKAALLLALGIVAVAMIFTVSEEDDIIQADDEQVLAKLGHDPTYAAYAN